MMNIQNINQLVTELESNSLIDSKIELGDPIKENNYKMVENEIGLKLKDHFHDVFNIHRSVEILCKAKDQSIVSECSIEGLKYSFNEYAQSEYVHSFDEFDPQFKDLAKTLYAVDVYRKSSDSVTSTVVKIINENELEFWIWNNSGHKYKLVFNSFTEYVNSGIACKFCVFWQYFYLDTGSINFNEQFTQNWLASSFSEGISRMEISLELMKTYFPKEDWTSKETELERVKNL